MGWLCPTFQRPDRLQEMSETWHDTAEDIPLLVRIWKDDPRKEEYYRTAYPPEITFFESEDEWAGEALHSYFEQFPNEEFYGFIGDDVLLETPDGIEQLIFEAGDFCIAYPNDTIQRHRLCTHFCIGGDLVRTAGFLVPTGMRHHYIDNVWMELGLNTGLLRYRPDIIFRHNHFLRGKVGFDSTYQRVYNENGSMKEGPEDIGRTQFNLWREYREKYDIVKVRRMMLKLFEGVEVSDEAVERLRAEEVKERAAVA